jgi:hypothetical protein
LRRGVCHALLLQSHDKLEEILIWDYVRLQQSSHLQINALAAYTLDTYVHKERTVKIKSGRSLLR